MKWREMLRNISEIFWYWYPFLSFIFVLAVIYIILTLIYIILTLEIEFIAWIAGKVALIL